MPRTSLDKYSRMNNPLNLLITNYKKQRKMTDTEIAKGIGLSSRDWVCRKAKQDVGEWKVRELVGFANVLGIPPEEIYEAIISYYS